MGLRLDWHKFRNMYDATCDGHGNNPAVFAITNPHLQALYIGMTTKGLASRFRVGTLNAIDAAIQCLHYFVLVGELRTSVSEEELERIESE